ncbi:aminotransferase class IV [Rufibacter roseus]|uniref:branched-chain-amino-acid transaminase n=1 Tax=Rufibacter roseus TaxID=1567108 RepID=A0ABW2DU10_9BACT|nr:aminotransferase class IV [Rufibacter roseus]
MFLIYNGQSIQESELRLPLSNRAFQYNDGFFETIILKDGQVRFWQEHLERIKEAAAVLKIDLPAELLNNDFPEVVKKLAAQNKGGAFARIKLKVWRSGAGLYTPEQNQADWLLTAQPTQELAMAPISVDVCQSIRTIPSPFSSFKGINSPVYVLASQEKTERQLEDLILLSPLGHVAELTYSNIFWLKDNTLYTPALETGCLNGIMRRKLLRWATQTSFKMEEGLFVPQAIHEAELTFGGNVTGFRVINSLEGITLSVDSSLFERISQVLQ